MNLLSSVRADFLLWFIAQCAKVVLNSHLKGTFPSLKRNGGCSLIERWRQNCSIQDKRLNHQFRVFALLLLLMPTVVFLYIVSGLSSFSELLQAKYLIPYLFSIVIILCVLALLQSLFMQVSTISTAMVTGSEHVLEELKELKIAYELRGIADGFGALLDQYRKAGSDLQRRSLELLLVKELAQEAGTSLDMNKLLAVLLDKAMQVNKARIGSVFLVDEDGKNFQVVCSREPEGETFTGAIIAIKDSIVRHMLDVGTGPLLVDDIETDIRFRKKSDPKYGSPSFLSLPIHSGDRLIAVLNLAAKDGGEAFQQQDVDLASIMVQEVGFALENARVHAELKQQAVRLEQQTVSLKEEIHFRKLAEKELEHLAHRDPLTGLSNRYMFIDRLEVALAQAERQKKRLAVMFVDLNRFKDINDTLGHGGGDDVLREVSNRMTTCLRKTDLLARYGGDEFTCILMDVTAREGMDNVANKIIDVLQKPLVVNEIEFTIGCSIGISIYPDNSEDIEELIQHADSAMYVSKRTKDKDSSFHYYTEGD